MRSNYNTFCKEYLFFCIVSTFYFRVNLFINVLVTLAKKFFTKKLNVIESRWPYNAIVKRYIGISIKIMKNYLHITGFAKTYPEFV